MTYKLKLNHLNLSKFCEVSDYDGNIIYTVKDGGVFSSGYEVYKGDYKIIDIDCSVERHTIGEQENVLIYVTAYDGNTQIANISFTSEILTKQNYTISGFDYKIKSNWIGTYFKVTDSEDNIIAHIDSGVLSSDYVINVLNNADENIIIACLMMIIYKTNNPVNTANNIRNNIINNIIGNTFKMD